MKKDYLIIQDISYISARRAAEIAGYTADYVGQLCRAGKVQCRMVGRTWYVNEESILNHQKSAFNSNSYSFGSKDYDSNKSYPVQSPSLNYPIFVGSSANTQSSISLNSNHFNSHFLHAFLTLGQLITNFAKYSFIIIVVFVFFFFTSSMLFSSATKQSSLISVNSSELTAQASGVFNIVSELAKSIWNKAYSLIVPVSNTKLANQTVDQNNSEDNLVAETVADQSGLVVVPSQGSDSNNLKLAGSIEKVKIPD